MIRGRSGSRPRFDRRGRHARHRDRRPCRTGSRLRPDPTAARCSTAPRAYVAGYVKALSSVVSEERYEQVWIQRREPDRDHGSADRR